jgi:hypothetical protein
MMGTPAAHYLLSLIKTQACLTICGGGVWESNPPFDPRRAESAALKAATVTGPFSPPVAYYISYAKSELRQHFARQRNSHLRFIAESGLVPRGALGFSKCYLAAGIP